MQAISSAINTVENLGHAAGDVVTGHFDKLGSDIASTVQSGLPLAADAFMAMNPELGMVSGLSGLLGNLTGAAGGFNLGQAGGLPGAFSPGNLIQNALNSLFGGSGGSSGGGGGIPDFNQLTQGLTQMAGGDPTSLFNQQKSIDQGAEAFQLAQSLEQLRHAEFMSVAKAIGQAYS